MQLNEIFSRLRKVKDNPCVSILMPTHRLAPEYAQDKLALKNMVLDAKEQLLKQFHERGIKGVIANLDAALANYDPHRNRSSLGVFVSEHVCEVLYLNVSAAAQVVIEDNFATRVLVNATTTESSYYILTLSEKHAHLLEAYEDRAHESHAGNLPVTNKHHHVSAKLRANWTKEEDKQARDYFAEVDAHLDDVLKGSNMLLVVAGAEHTLDNFRHVSRHNANILAAVQGNFDNSTAADVGRVAWPHVLEALKRRMEASLELLNEARSGNKVAVGPEEVYTMAKQGRGQILFAEADYYQPAGRKGDQIDVNAVSGADGYVSDVVDEIAETVLDMKGEVQFVQKGMLAPFGSPIALVLRY